MKCTDCKYLGWTGGRPWCEAGKVSQRIRPGAEDKDLPCDNAERRICEDEKSD